MFQNLKLGPRLIVGFLVPVVLLLVLGGVSLVALQTERSNMTALYNDRVVPLKQLKVIADAYAVNVIDAVNKANAGVFTAEEAHKEVQTAQQSIDKEWAAYMATTLTPEEAQLAKEAVGLFEAAKRDLRTVEAALKGKTGPVTGQLNDFDGPLYASIDPISAKITELIDLQLRVAAEVNQSSEVNHQQVLWIQGAVVALAAILSMWVAWSIAQSVVRPVSQAQRLAEAIAQGDLTQRVQAQGRDEVAELVRALSRMSDYLTRVVTTVRLSSDQVAQGAAEIAMGTADLSQRTESQAANIEETSASMSELTEAVRHNADTSREASQLAGRARESATRGGESVSAVVSTMQEIEASSRRIADIIGVIDGIAFQTNILALNAAVEAARAGEQGRGFAVVAGEVRSLAQRSAEAAKEIKDLISDSVQRVAVGSEQVAEAGASVNDIVSQVQRVADLINEITHASGEQSQGIAEVSTAVSQMDQATQQNAALVEESTSAAESLRSQAELLVQEVSAFRVN